MEPKWEYDESRPEGERWYLKTEERTQEEPLQWQPSPVAMTAGEQDHSNPWAFAGEEVPPPQDP